LPSPFGIGDLGPQAKEFAHFLQRSHQTFWQLLPLNPTTVSNSNSPYSANSGMAGNPLLISPELLVEEGLLTEKDIAPYKMKETDKVDFEKAEENKCTLLEAV
jgi:4-alpha-glucanotransferase